MSSPQTNDKVFIYPTDTVWGIGCNIYSESAVLKVHEVKGSDSQKPVSILWRDLSIFNLERMPCKTSWLEEFFSLETTLLLSPSFLRIDIPDWIKRGSDFVGCRILKTKEIIDLCDRVKAPIVSTSLNITSEPPITCDQKAFEFHASLAESDYTFIPRLSSKLSGNSSTIVAYNDGKFNILREGSCVSEVKQHLELFSA